MVLSKSLGAGYKPLTWTHYPHHEEKERRGKMFEKVWDNMFEGGSLWAGILTGTVAQLQDTFALTNGRIKSNEYAVSTAKNATMALGTMAGVEAGAVLGSAVMPGFGTMVGSILGGMVGDRVGAYVGQQAGSLAFQNATQTQPAPAGVPVSQ